MSNLREEASKAYYEGKPILTDEEFDALPEDDAVGYNPTGASVTHEYRMYSLQKAYGDENPLANYKGKKTSSPKLDGAAVALQYDIGFVSGATRGNGIVGIDISEKVKLLVPDYVGLTGQITGEVVAPKHIKNSRNYAAGALNLKSVEEFRSRDLKFIAYGITPSLTDSWSKDMAILRERGFNTVLDGDWNEYPQDGVVHRVDDYNDFDDMGYTAKHPRGAFAFKVQAEAVVTTLLDVEWNVGRSGVVAPTAILEPVLVGDAKVSRATLHNIAYIEELGLELGCKVEIIRSGEIIPRIIRKV